MKHSDCGGHVGEYGNKYRYCSEHDNGCDTATCPKAVDIPEYRCDKCGQEITGDAQMEVETAEEHAFMGMPRLLGRSTPEIAKRVRNDIRAARETLRRIMEHEAPYLGEP